MKICCSKNSVVQCLVVRDPNNEVAERLVSRKEQLAEKKQMQSEGQDLPCKNCINKESFSLLLVSVKLINDNDLCCPIMKLHSMTCRFDSISSH